MDHWLNNAPGLIFLKELSTWFILNHKCEPVIWIEGESELAWYFACVECGATTEHNYLSSKNSNDLKLPPNTQSRTPQRDRQLTDCAFDAAVIKLFTEDIKVCFV
jgi:hypothetical protein